MVKLKDEVGKGWWESSMRSSPIAPLAMAAHHPTLTCAPPCAIQPFSPPLLHLPQLLEGEADGGARGGEEEAVDSGLAAADSPSFASIEAVHHRFVFLPSDSSSSRVGEGGAESGGGSSRGCHHVGEGRTDDAVGTVGSDLPARAFQRRSRFDAHEVFLDPRGVPNRRLPTHTVRSCGVEQRREKGMRGGRRVGI
uniref:Uncharacterized protein n=1 Tax=Setaria viridis TaxID=4556 RepID=A0A4U6TNA5_SETVI|nr:hypothetical protein SEVIR_7G094300v2 [Setaria viridis]